MGPRELAVDLQVLPGQRSIFRFKHSVCLRASAPFPAHISGVFGATLCRFTKRGSFCGCHWPQAPFVVALSHSALFVYFLPYQLLSPLSLWPRDHCSMFPMIGRYLFIPSMFLISIPNFIQILSCSLLPVSFRSATILILNQIKYIKNFSPPFLPNITFSTIYSLQTTLKIIVYILSWASLLIGFIGFLR